ncbi:MAG TPA: hypothetical protein VGS07_20190 [Thermoanaerobaculia bacterium]|jgi:hypothetical protein|nr:hypothetical protein [Thermoanaerobaculia bacterium]
MASASFRRKTVLLLLLAVLVAPWASAAGRPAGLPGPGAVSAPAPLDLFGSALRLLTRLWSKEGCRIDPSGRCAPLSTPTSDTGCRIDPDGLCRS